MKPNFAVISGLEKPKPKPGSPPPLPKREEEPEMPMRGMGKPGTEAAHGIGIPISEWQRGPNDKSLAMPEPQPEPVAPTGIGAVAERYGLDEATGTAFLREALKALLPEEEGGEYPPAA